MFGFAADKVTWCSLFNRYRNTLLYLKCLEYSSQAFNATEEIAKADSYSDIRLFTVQRVTSATPLAEPPVILQPWSVASQSNYKKMQH